ncbi:MAG: TIGR04372 family glycosyltransferase [Betaproteobacteria bacterium]
MKALRPSLVRFKFALVRAREEGMGWTFRQLLRRSGTAAASVALLPLTIALLVAGYRRLPVITTRIGHLAAEVDCFLKEVELGRLPRRRWFIVASPDKIANPTLLHYWNGRVPVVRAPAMAAVLDLCTRHWATLPRLREYVLALNGPARYFEVNTAWGARAPTISLTPEHEVRGRKVLLELGLPPGAWFVCIHAREPGYAAHDDAIHAYRNSRIDDLLPAVHAIGRHGGWSIRVGDPTGQRLAGIDRCIDYAHHRLRSDWMDIFLGASCRFFLGNTSGLFVVSTIFGVPCALANMTPVASLGFRIGDLAIPKMLWSTQERRLLTFDEAFNSPAAGYRMSRQFAAAGLEVRDNTAEEILELTEEMIARLESKAAGYETYDVLQRRFAALIRPEHYCWGASSRVGSLFLAKYEHLLPAAA